MNTASYQSRLLLICSLWGIVCFSAGCRQPALNGHEQHNASYKYGILINAKKGERTNDRIVWINSLDTGHIDPEKNVTDLSQKLGTHVIMGNGFLLSFNKTTHQLSKYKLNGQELILNDSIKLKQFDYLSSSINLDSNKLYLSGHSTENADSYTIIDTRYMRLLKSASLKLPVAPKQILSQNFAVRIADKLYIGYSSFDEKYEFSSDTSYLAIFSYPNLTRLNIAKDTRSAFPGTGVNGLFNTFSDHKGDLYIVTAPIYYLGNNPNASTGFFRVNKGAQSFDKDYFFNLSSLINGGHLLGITYAGNGKVIMATTRYPSQKKSDFYVADVYNKTLKPLLKDKHEPNYTWGTGGFNEGSKAWFIVNENNNAQIYSYNSLTGELRKGAIIKGIVSDQSSYLIFSSRK